MPTRKPKLAIIDAHALIHRAYHALPPMNAPDGTPTNAVYGFTTMLLKMFTTLKPTHVVAAFDVKGETFREKMYKEYKSQREAPADDLVAQFDVVRSVLEAFSIPTISKKGFEADDIIGTLVHRIDGNVKKIIVTGDMDTLQLVNDTTFVFTLKRGISDTILYDETLVREKYGFGPEYMIDYKGLRGDPSDNIPGVAGIGEKTAKELISAFGTVEEVYRNLDAITGRAKTKLEGQQEIAMLSKKLATIKCDVSIQFDLKNAELSGYSTERVQKLFTDLGFRSLLARMPDGGSSVQPTLFTSKQDIDGYHVVQSEKEQEDLRKLLAKADIIAFDTETEGLGARTSPIVGMSFAYRDKAYYIPVDRESVKSWKQFFENPEIKKTGHNVKYDISVLMQSGIHPAGIVFDSMVASYLLRPTSRQHSLDALALSELDHRTIPITDLIGEGKNQKKMSEVPLEDLVRYACEDADISLKLYEHFEPQLKEAGIRNLFSEIEIPLVTVLATMELAGVEVDVPALKKLQKRISSRIYQLEKSIHKDAGNAFNVSSTKQLRGVLFDVLKLPTVGIKRTQTGYSTASSELEKLHGQHPIIEKIEEHRELSKLLNTYVATLPQLVDKTTRRIYTSFNQVVAATGRLSSQDPNLQNIPIKSELGQEIRAAFVAPKGKRFVKADYSQIELRLAAHISQDEKMIDVFRAGKDFHAATAAWVLGIPESKVTEQQRRQAKALNFGVLYGMGPQSFARQAGISVEEARSFIGRYFEQFSKLAECIAVTIEQARELEKVETLFGRRRPVPEINSNNPALAAQAERIAFNFPLQGTAADILKKAMIALHKEIKENFPETRMVLTVHDELVCEVPEKQATAFAKRMKNIMESVMALDVPLIVDVGIGKNWRDIKEIRTR